jgi:hypothetical protein
MYGIVVLWLNYDYWDCKNISYFLAAKTLTLKIMFYI